MRTSLEGELNAHLRHLCDHIGARPVGSQANNAAGQYIRSVFASAGLQVSEQRFDWIDWKSEKAALELESTPLRVYANTYSPSCNVSAPTVALGTLAELERADLRGKIAVLYGSLTQAPLTPKDFPLYSVERDQRIIPLLEQKEPAAIITVNLQPPSVERLIEDHTFSIPSATVAADVGLKLLEREGQNAHLTLVTQRTPSEAANILGRKANKRPERIVICAHYDTKFDTPGAIDNGSGTAALLSLARILSKSELDISLEFVAFNDEEYFSQGDTVYANASDFSNILAAINLDGIGQRLGATTMAIMSHSQALRACVETVAAQYPGFVWVDPWPQSNHSTFAWRGVPSLALTSYFAGVTRFDHQPADSTRWVSSARLAEVVTFVREVVENIQQETLTWARPSGQP